MGICGEQINSYEKKPSMTKLLSIRVNGTPKATPRTRSSHQHGKTHHWTPPTANAWKAAIADAVGPPRAEINRAVPMKLCISIWLDRPQSHFDGLGHPKNSASEYPTSKPDFDNLSKCVADMLTKSMFWKDDSYVVDCEFSKRWADDRLAGALIEVFAL